MKLLLLGVSLLTGGGVVVMENEVVNETVTKATIQVREMFQKRVGSNLAETVKESGFPYPNEEYTATLTEEQSFEIFSAIDVINAMYDWQSMTDEEIFDALAIIKEEMQALYLELGVDAPAVQTRTQMRTQIRQGGNGKNGNSIDGNTGNFGSNETHDGSCEEVPTQDSSDTA